MAEAKGEAKGSSRFRDGGPAPGSLEDEKARK